MKRNSIALVLLIMFILTPTVAYAGTFANSVGKVIGYWIGQKIKEDKKVQKDWNREVEKQQRTWEKDMYETEIGKVTQENPLQRNYLQKIEVYKAILKKNKNQRTIKEIINHIEIYGRQQYGDSLNKRFTEFEQELIDVNKKIEQEKAKKDNGINKDLAGLTLIGGLAYILRLVIFKIPV